MLYYFPGSYNDVTGSTHITCWAEKVTGPSAGLSWPSLFIFYRIINGDVLMLLHTAQKTRSQYASFDFQCWSHCVQVLWKMKDCIENSQAPRFWCYTSRKVKPQCVYSKISQFHDCLTARFTSTAQKSLESCHGASSVTSYSIIIRVKVIRRPECMLVISSRVL